MKKIKMIKVLKIKFHMMMARIWKVKSSMTQIRCKIKIICKKNSINAPVPHWVMRLESLKAHKLLRIEILRSMRYTHLAGHKR